MREVSLKDERYIQKNQRKTHIKRLLTPKENIKDSSVSTKVLFGLIPNHLSQIFPVIDINN